MRSGKVGIAFALLTGLAWAQSPAPRVDGSAVYKDKCAACHDAGIDRAPKFDSLRQMAPQSVLAALESGAMVQMATGLSSEQRPAVSELVAGKTLAAT
jgi:polyvinyl alcohol dehydrogenase (cytochrome)